MYLQVCFLSAHEVVESIIAKKQFSRRKITLQWQFLVKGMLRDLFQFYLFYCRKRKSK